MGVVCVVAGLSLGMISSGGAGADEAGPESHDAYNFATGNGQPSGTYRAVEDETASIYVARGTHGEGKATVDLSASEGTATDPGDFNSYTKTLTFWSPIEVNEQFMPLVDDVHPEALETVNLSLDNATNNMVAAFPTEAVLTIVDDDGPARVSFEFAGYSVFENKGSVVLRVIRSGDAGSAASVNYTLSPGSATPGNDYRVSSGTITFGPQERYKTFAVGIVDDQSPESTESFSANLSGPSGMVLSGMGADATTATVTIYDDDKGGTPDDSTAPYTAFHQPLQGKTYGRKVSKEFLVFMQDDEGGSGMSRVQLGLRKKLRNGRCAWWVGGRFERRPCSKKLWAKTGGKTKVQYYSDMASFTMSKGLKPTTKATGIRNYRAFSRGWDKVGNVQTTFIKGQNKNTFKVK